MYEITSTSQFIFVAIELKQEYIEGFSRGRNQFVEFENTHLKIILRPCLFGLKYIETGLVQ